MLPPNPHEVVVPPGGPQPSGRAGKDSEDSEEDASGSSSSSSSGGGGLKRGRPAEGEQDSAGAGAEDDDHASMFASMFETAVGMAAEMAEQQLGLEGQDIDEEGAEGEGEEDASGNEGAE